MILIIIIIIIVIILILLLIISIYIYVYHYVRYVKIDALDIIKNWQTNHPTFTEKIAKTELKIIPMGFL